MSQEMQWYRSLEMEQSEMGTIRTQKQWKRRLSTARKIGAELLIFVRKTISFCAGISILMKLGKTQNHELLDEMLPNRLAMGKIYLFETKCN